MKLTLDLDTNHERERKRKKDVFKLLISKTLDETWSQFYQHFTFKFFVWKFFSQLFSKFVLDL